jgi:hypothetical protein
VAIKLIYLALRQINAKRQRPPKEWLLPSATGNTIQ